MIQSLLIKLAMLAVTMGAVFWIGWQVPQAFQSDAPPESVVVPAQQSREPETKRPAADGAKAASKHSADRSHVAGAPADSPGLLDLNRASADELQALPGIGPVLAQRVVEYRTSSGGFRSVEDLRQVKGIGAKKFDRVRRLVRTSAPAPGGKAEKRQS